MGKRLGLGGIPLGLGIDSKRGFRGQSFELKGLGVVLKAFWYWK